MEPNQLSSNIPERDRWSHVKSILERESRFYNLSVVKELEYVFGTNKDYKKLYRDESVVRKVECGAGYNIFRARHFASPDGARRALLVPERELAGPPHSAAKAGRMNADGISVFYGANDKDVALAEIRPPVGSYVVIARFRVSEKKERIKLLDVEGLREAYGEYIPKGSDKDINARFIENFSNQVTTPIVPENESTEYIITQVVSDYLSSRTDIGIDGLIYKSAQSDAKNNNNIVLFHRSSKVKALNDSEEAASLISKIKSSGFDVLSKEELTKKRNSYKEHFIADGNSKDRDSALELDIDSISLYQVKNAKFGAEPAQIQQ